MKAFICFILLAIMGSQGYGQENTLRTETTSQFDQTVDGVSIQRLQFDNPKVSIKGDHKTDLSGKNVIDDVLGVFWKNTFESKTSSFDIGIIKKGDWLKNDEYFLDLTYTQNWKNTSLMVDIGRGFKADDMPRDYIISRFTHLRFLIEAGLLSKHGYSNFDEFAYEKYYWGAVYPDNVFVSLGRQVNTTWASFGTRDMLNFGNFTFFSYDDVNGNYWGRTQFGFEEVNQNFFNTKNFIVGMSYLNLPSFFYKRFGPICTKGTYGFKIDAIRTASLEKYEVIASRKIGVFGYVAAGWEREVPNRDGVILEYYKEIMFNTFKASLELKYESIYSRVSGFLVTSYQF